jgi:hypothetical protein
MPILIKLYNEIISKYLLRFWASIQKLQKMLQNELFPKLKDSFISTYHLILKSVNNYFTKYKQLPRYQSLMILIIFIWIFTTLWIVFFWDVQLDVEDDPGTLYLLSALAQSMAAIFALVFTILLVITQLSSTYSHRIPSILIDRITLIYMFIFISAIVITLWSIIMAEKIYWVKISISLSILCVYALIPFFLRFRELLNPEYLLLKLNEAAQNKIKSNAINEPEEIKMIEDITLKASDLRDYEALKLGAEILSNLSFLAAQQIGNEYKNINTKLIETSILDRIKDMFEITFPNHNAPLIISNTLGETYSIAIEDEFANASSLGYRYFAEMAFTSMAKGSEWISINICKKLTQIGTTSLDNDKHDICRFTVTSIFAIGKEANNYKFDKLIEESISSLIEIGAWANYKSSSDGLLELIVSYLCQLETILTDIENQEVDIFSLNPLLLLTYSTIDTSLTDNFQQFQDYYQDYKTENTKLDES